MADGWVDGLDWQCRSCGSTWPSRWARDACELEDEDADREARR